MLAVAELERVHAHATIDKMEQQVLGVLEQTLSADAQSRIQAELQLNQLFLDGRTCASSPRAATRRADPLQAQARPPPWLASPMPASSSFTNDR